MSADSSMDWVLSEARRVGPLLEGQYAVVISGADPHASAQVALELARIHSATRRVAIADLIGDAPALLAAVTDGDEDPHGISDSFFYGVSLNRIARPIDPAGNVFLMPSGTEAVALPEVYGNDRWRRLAAGFEQVGALLLVVAKPDVEGFRALCQYVGASLPLNRAQRPDPIDGVHMLWLESDGSRAALAALARGATPAAGTAYASAGPAGSGAHTVPDDAGRQLERTAERIVERKVERAREVATEDRAQRQSRVLATVAAAAAVVLLGLAAWPTVQARIFPGTTQAVAAADSLDSAAENAVSAGGSADAAVPDEASTAPLAEGGGEAAGTLATERTGSTGGTGSTGRGERIRASAGPLVIANPGDSARAAAFAVYFVAANTVEEARPPAGLATMAGVAVSPVVLGTAGAQWYRVTVGAGSDSADATALLVRLRAANQIGSANGSIIRVPFAFQLEDGVAAAQANEALDRWAKRGIRAYVLRQPNGEVTVYTGAFQSVRQAGVLADSLVGVGIPPTLVYRTGRTF